MYRKIWLKALRVARSYHTSSIPKPKTHPRRPLEPDQSWPSTKHPTPYDILGVRKGQPYHKRKYYHLVKAYHPDLNTSHRLSKATQTDRFRLVVAAHEILSDTTKRAAYDMYGAGWSSPSRPNCDDSRTYRGSFNREHDSNPRQEGDSDVWVLLSTHKHLLRLLAVVFTFGEICLFLVTLSKAEIELNRIDKQCRELVWYRQLRSLDAPSLLQLERFLLRRDPSGMGLAPDESESYRAVSPMCMH